MTDTHFPELQTARLRLRALRLSDIKDLLAYATDHETALMGMWDPLRDHQDAHDDITRSQKAASEGKIFPWAIEHRREGRMIGRIDLYDLKNGSARGEFGYALNRDYWGHGFATEAARRVMKFAFDSLRLNRVSAECLAINTGSIRVLEKCGFKQEGRRREYLMINGQYIDLLMYSVLRREWESNKQWQGR